MKKITILIGCIVLANFSVACGAPPSDPNDSPGGSTSVFDVNVRGRNVTCVSLDGNSYNGGISCNWDAYNKFSGPQSN